MISYQIYIKVQKDIELQIGKLGNFKFYKGNYIYTGSAKKNIDHRIARHKANSINKKLHWHIDYLLASDFVEITKITKFTINECCLNKKTKGDILIKGFGSSDCKNNCQSHLKYLR